MDTHTDENTLDNAILIYLSGMSESLALREEVKVGLSEMDRLAVLGRRMMALTTLFYTTYCLSHNGQEFREKQAKLGMSVTTVWINIDLAMAEYTRYQDVREAFIKNTLLPMNLGTSEPKEFFNEMKSVINKMNSINGDAKIVMISCVETVSAFIPAEDVVLRKEAGDILFQLKKENLSVKNAEKTADIRIEKKAVTDEFFLGTKEQFKRIVLPQVNEYLELAGIQVGLVPELYQSALNAAAKKSKNTLPLKDMPGVMVVSSPNDNALIRDIAQKHDELTVTTEEAAQKLDDIKNDVLKNGHTPANMGYSIELIKSINRETRRQLIPLVQDITDLIPASDSKLRKEAQELHAMLIIPMRAERVKERGASSSPAPGEG